MKPTLTGSSLIHLFAHRRTRMAASSLGVVALILISFGLGLLTSEQTIEKQNIELPDKSNSTSELGKTKDVEEQDPAKDSLNTLNEMHENGLLTDEELELARRKILQ